MISPYENIYNLILQYVYGNTLPQSGELVVDLLATSACVALVALPFALVYAIIRAITNY